MTQNILNLPNAMTLFRIPAGIAMLWLLMHMDPARYPDGYPMWIAISIAVISFLTFLTDFLDGRVARHYKIVTDFGKIMDPVSDSMFFILLLLGLAMSQRFQVTIAFTVMMLFRESGVQIIRREAALKGVVLMAGWAGKLKMVLQAIVMAILGFAVLFTDTKIYVFSEVSLQWLAWTGSMVAAVAGLLSLAMYCKQLPEMIDAQRKAAKVENQ